VAPHVEEEDSYSEHSDDGEVEGRSQAVHSWSEQFTDWEEFIAAQNTGARGEDTRDSAPIRETQPPLLKIKGRTKLMEMF
jgi:hypothetical protein